MLAMRDAFGEALVEAGRKNNNIVALTANLEESTRLSAFHQEFPDRFFDLGVAEQNLIGVAAGLALSDKIPFITSFGVFSPGRNWDQLRISVCYSRANVKIVATHCGLSVGQDGASHQALEDLAITRCLPNLIVLAPADYYETKQVIQQAIIHQGPVYIRLPRSETPIIFDSTVDFKIGQAQILQSGTDLTIFAYGPMLAIALQTAQILKSFGLMTEVINISSIKPLPEKIVINSAKKTKFVVSIEDHQIFGGLGSAVAELLSEKQPTKMMIFGVPDKFGESGQLAELYEKFGLTPTLIAGKLKKVLL